MNGYYEDLQGTFSLKVILKAGETIPVLVCYHRAPRIEAAARANKKLPRSCSGHQTPLKHQLSS